MNYEKMYHLLFNAITDALEQMEKQKDAIHLSYEMYCR